MGLRETERRSARSSAAAVFAAARGVFLLLTSRSFSSLDAASLSDLAWLRLRSSMETSLVSTSQSWVREAVEEEVWTVWTQAKREKAKADDR